MRKAKKWAILAVMFFAAFSLFAAEEALPEFVAKHRVMLWNFESGTTEGWHGLGTQAKVCSVVPVKGDPAGSKFRLKADITGSMGWNQEAMMFDGPFTKDMYRLVEFSFDVDIPAESVKGLEYQQLVLVIQSKTNQFYQSANKDVMPGKSRVVFKIDPSKFKEDLWHIILIVNNTQPFKGPIYIDNIGGRLMGDDGEVEGKVVDSVTKQGVSEAKVIVGDVLVKTDGGGNFKIKVAEDRYKAAVTIYGYKDKVLNNVDVMANQTLKMGNIEIVKSKAPVVDAVDVTIDPSVVIKEIDKHKLYGQNIAAWHKPNGYRDEEAINKLKKIGATFIRMPGGDYGNLYDWRSGDVYRPEGGKSWTPETNYMGVMVPFMLRMEGVMGKGSMEAMPIINVMTPVEKSIEERIKYGILWLKDMKMKGIKFRYVEIGNEPDNKPGFYGPKVIKGKKWYETPGDKKVTKWWTSIDNYSKVFNLAAKMIKEDPELKDLNLKIMGPCPMQPMNKQRLAGEPWKAETENPKSPYWVERFLQKSADYVDALVVHEYPLWANNDARALLAKPQETWPKYMPLFKSWIKKYVNSKYPEKNIEIALTEWNSGNENSMTVTMENALFCADYLGSYMSMGGDLAFVWDIYTQKPGLGGGHGQMDSENDPTNKYSERASYWVFDMYNNAFGTKMVKCSSSSDRLSVYAAKVDDNTISVMAINKTRLAIANAKFNVAGFNFSNSAKVWQFSEKEYVWSKELYRPIVNTGVSKFDVNLKDGAYEFPPYSVTVIHLKK